MPTARRPCLLQGLIPLACLALLTSACADPSQNGLPQEGASGTQEGKVPAQDVVIAVGSEPDTLNPVLGYARWGDGKVVEGLLQLGVDLVPEPLLAESLPEVSDDGLTWTYTLRDGVRFHDGTLLSADDVVYTYESALDPDLGSAVAADLTALAAVEAVDERTVRFTLDRPHASFPVATVLGIVPAGSDLDDVQVVGTGPYRMSSYRPGDRLVLTAHDDYWGEPPEVGRATFVFAEDDAARVARVASGEVDAALLPATSLARFEENDAFDVVRRDTSDFRAIIMPEEHPVAGDPAVRRALNLGLDRQSLVEGALAGSGRPAYGPIPPEAAEYSSVVEVDTDVPAARAVLEEAGWQEGPDGTRVRDGQRAELTLMYPAGDSLRQNIALYVQAQAGGLGIEVTPDGLSWDAIEPRMSQDPLVYGSGNPYDADLSTYPLLHSSRALVGFDNPGGYRSPELDAALESGRSALDDAERNAAYAEVQDLLAQDLPWIFLAYVGHDYVIRAGVWQGYDVPLVEPHEHGLQGGPWWNLPSWTSARR
ncbi:ABC transporter substrate-binding protein [Ornithinimicrobium pratense]|uniref:ABC transporter substrate-binding protein n=1 Tax=Ornithinimicrobium pratense TaxID=2593973 RepID=A0A5J6V5Z7_9MICO|nr:ABC transporter substrate-binding protein [Ornithinimicrobium pratense]QFG69027.1 ABC transporter substrate-binding protein [Ornithinimicrobium pratense]